MKKVLVGSLAVLAAVPAFAADVAMPTIYGQVNKEIRYVSQKKEFGYSKVSNVVDVANSESRLGAKGTFEGLGTLKVNYNLLVGLNSSDSNTSGGSGTGRVRIRNAEFGFTDFWGTVFGGQTADIASVVGATVDPLATTFAGAAGYDQKDAIKNQVTSLGYIDRGRYDQIGFKTAEYFGLQYSIATAKLSVGDGVTDDNALTASTTGAAAHAGTRINNVLSYNLKMNDMMNLKAWVSYNNFNSGAFKKYSDYLGAVAFTYGEFTLAGEYTSQEKQTNAANAFTKKYKMMQASLKWVRGDHTVAATYANRKNEEVADKAGSTTTFENFGKYSQIAVGYMYALNKNVQLKGIYSLNTVKTDSTTAGLDPKNTANTVSVGTLISF